MRYYLWVFLYKFSIFAFKMQERVEKKGYVMRYWVNFFNK